MATFQDIATSASINLLGAFLFLFVFSVLRLQPQNARVYYPKWYIKGIRKSSAKQKTSRWVSISHYINTDYKAYIKLLDWMWVALRMPEAELIDHAGLDAAVFLRIFLLGLKIFLPMAGLGFSILMPVNVTDHNLVFQTTKTNSSADDLTYSEIDKLSIANVKDKSDRLWTHLLMSYVFTVWTCAMLYMEFRKVANMRLLHLATRKRAPNQFTVLVRQVPPDPERSVGEHVETFFRLTHPEYLQTQVVYNANKLASLLQQKASLENWLQYSQIKYEKRPGRRPTMKTGFLGLFGDTVDAIDYYTAEIEKLNKEAAVEQEVVLRDSQSIMPAAFVSFKSRWAAAVCAQTQQTRNPTKWITDWAPEPRDVYWKNLAIPYLSLTMRNVVMGGALFLLIFFYLIPVAAVQSLANLDGVVKKVKFLRPIMEKPIVKSLIQGFLPGLVLKIFLALLPSILMAMAKFEGHLSRSVLDRVSAKKLYYFMVVNVFFGSVITGSLAEQIKVIVESSSVTNILKTLGNSIPMKATFFITYIMVDGWAGVSLEIIRLVPLILYHLKNVLLVKTTKDRDQAMAPGNLLLDQNIPRLELYFLLGIVYSVITPLILPFIIMFFGFGYLAYRNQVINIYDPDYDSAAAFWPHVHVRIIVAMIIEQLTLIGLFTIKGPIGFVKEDNLSGTKHKALRYLRQILSSTPFMVLLPICTLIFHFHCRKRFEAAFLDYPLEDAMAKDRQEKKHSPNLDLTEYLDKAYLHPVLKEEEEYLMKEKTLASRGHGNGNGTDVETGEEDNNPEGEEQEEEHAQGSDDEFRMAETTRDDLSEEFADALSRRPSLMGDESPTEFDSFSSTPSTPLNASTPPSNRPQV